jgi:DNA-binding NarL/FixJ family response regulator
MKYTILYIDEESTQHDMFMDYFEAACQDAIPKCEFPLPTLDEMIKKIWSLCPDAIVTDFQLNDKKLDVDYTVKYNGVELIRALREQRENFPCFVITSFDDEAVNDSDDVNLVYIKDVLTHESNNAKAIFAERVTHQIDKYRSRIETAKQELSDLMDKRRREEVNIYEEQRIIELDTFLEKAFNAESNVPFELKTFSNMNKLKELINKVDELLERI